LGQQDTPGRTPDPVLVVGAASRDLVDDDPRGWRLGGAVTYVSLALAGLGLPVRCAIGLDGHARTAAELDHLRARGATIHEIPLVRGPVFRITETAAVRRLESLGPSDRIAPADIPPAWLAGPLAAIVLAPVADELDDAWGPVARAVAPVVALGWQGLLRRLEPGAPVTRLAPVARPLTRAADLVVVSRDDVDPGTSIESLLAALASAATLVVTAGEAGGIVSTPDPAAADRDPEGRDGGHRRLRRYRAIPPDAVVDPVGAGDTFLAGLVAARVTRALVPARPGEDLRLAAAIASLTVEGPGLRGVPRLGAVLERLRRPAAG
jgi:sugar/nucleoside kinase (ribokinase family)